MWNALNDPSACLGASENEKGIVPIDVTVVEPRDPRALLASRSRFEMRFLGRPESSENRVLTKEGTRSCRWKVVGKVNGMYHRGEYLIYVRARVAVNRTANEKRQTAEMF